MLIQIDFAECDGCGLRVPAVEMPDIWIQIQQNGEQTRMYCSSACYAEGDSASIESRQASRAALFRLTPIDLAVLNEMAEGASNGEMAFKSGVRTNTIKNRNSVLFRKLNVPGRIEAVLVAGYMKLIDLNSHGAKIRRTSRD